MATCTMSELHARLAREKHLAWVFFRGKHRDDQDEKTKGAFIQEGTSAWTGYWTGKPKISYDRIAYWNDESQILYIGKKSESPLKETKYPNGKKRWHIPMDDVEEFDVIPKSPSSVILQVVIPESIGRIQAPITYWPKSKDEFLKEQNRSISEKKTLSNAEAAKLTKDVDDTNADEVVKNEIRREIWCRTKAHAQFREKLINEWGKKCALTGMQGESLLVASHIKPWAACRDEPKLQTDINNGLILCTPIDKLFDRGYLTFNDDGSVELHKEEGHARWLGEESLAVFGLNTAKLPEIKQPLTAKTKEFLKYHRDNVFNRD
jgi:HNH endonuclease